MDKTTQPLVRKELLDNGLRRGQIDHLVRSDRWKRMYNGLYIDATLEPPDKELAERRAHITRCGDGAALSHHSAAAIHGLDTTWDRPPGTWLTVNDMRRIRPTTSAHVTRSLTLKSSDVEIIDGWPVTNRARTVLDLAALGIPDDELERIAESAMRSEDPRRPDLWRHDVFDQLTAYAQGDRRVRGSGALHRILARRGVDVRPTGSIAETSVIQGLRRRGVPHVVRQPTLTIISDDVRMIFPDILVDHVGLIVEMDGSDHAEILRRRQDLARQNLIVMGFTIFRYPATAGLHDADRISREVDAWVKQAERLGPRWTRGGVIVEGAGLNWTLRSKPRAA